MFKKILIANRGEIAVRIARACREMGIVSAAVFSDADGAALHVRLSDEAYRIGPAPSRESYLRIDKLMEIARRAGCDAVHPGYGFLAENPELARACKENNITFIGPSPEAMERLGSKTAARQLAARAGVPMVAGTQDPIANFNDAGNIAKGLGYPVLLKAVAGGGGKGMRLVSADSEMAGAWRDAASEALNAFGDARLYLEKYVDRPRHIEIQIFGDAHGHIVHLGERECSVQRRHQKVIEESPSPIMTPELRRAMGEAAVRLAKDAGYTNAGTVEFLVDAQRNFYFLEVNTRLQVEHPVTEMVTGLDLVKLQIRAAAGEPLPFSQEDVKLSGHAVECRRYAEDPGNQFFPSSGKFLYVTDIGFNYVVAFTFDSVTGALALVPGSAEDNYGFWNVSAGPYATGRNPRSIVIDPSGKFAYVGNVYSNNISAFSIDVTSGALAPIPGTPFPAGVGPASVAIVSSSSVPFEAFKAQAEIDEDRETSFRVEGFFKLGQGSDGIYPLSETVALQVGSFSATIPAGSFKEEGEHTFKFEGKINDVDLKITIQRIDGKRDDGKHDDGKHVEGNDYLFTAEGKGNILSGIVNPVTVGLTIGDDEGSTMLKADIDK